MHMRKIVATDLLGFPNSVGLKYRKSYRVFETQQDFFISKPYRDNLKCTQHDFYGSIMFRVGNAQFFLMSLDMQKKYK